MLLRCRCRLAVDQKFAESSAIDNRADPWRFTTSGPDRKNRRLEKPKSAE
jgi:hypothetical protein